MKKSNYIIFDCETGGLNPKENTLIKAKEDKNESSSGGALYALHCPDDSPLFVAIWYVIATAGVAVLGADPKGIRGAARVRRRRGFDQERASARLGRGFPAMGVGECSGERDSVQMHTPRGDGVDGLEFDMKRGFLTRGMFVTHDR